MWLNHPYHYFHYIVIRSDYQCRKMTAQIKKNTYNNYKIVWIQVRILYCLFYEMELGIWIFKPFTETKGASWAQTFAARVYIYFMICWDKMCYK